jgi:hypothetical protein
MFLETGVRARALDRTRRQFVGTHLKGRRGGPLGRLSNSVG